MMQTPETLPNLPPILINHNIENVSAVGNNSNFHFGVTVNHQAGIKEDAVKTCQDALLQTYPHADRDDLITTKGKRVDGTCEWILEDERYQSWLRGSTRLLWICGGPGKGKTMLAIFLSEEMERLARDTRGAVSLYYFCSGIDSERSGATAILRSLLWQINEQCPASAPYMLRYLDSSEKVKQTCTNRELLWSMLVEASQKSNIFTTFIVLDGLDECDEETQRWFSMKASDSDLSMTTIKITIVSRDIRYLRRSGLQIRIDNEHVMQTDQDVRRFISVRVQEIATLGNLSIGLRRGLEQDLFERSEGTFLWVGLVIIELLDKGTASQIERTLQSLPKGLPALYHRMLKRIEDRDADGVCIKILRWVSVASRPLSVPEIMAAIGTKHSSIISHDQAIRDHIQMSEPFLRCQQDEVLFVHQSAKDYLLGNSQDSAMLPEDFLVQAEDVHLQIAKACLDSISRGRIHELLEEEVGLPLSAALYNRDPFLNYAIYNWFKHGSSCSPEAFELLEHPSGFFQKRSSLRKTWQEIFTKQSLRVLPPATEPLQLACCLGVTVWVQKLIQKDRFKPRVYKSFNRGEFRADRPLHYAVERNHMATARVLLCAGAETAAKDAFGLDVLCLAIILGLAPMVRLLIEHGAIVNPKRHDSRNMYLSEAARVGHEEIVRVLLQHGASIEERSPKDRTPLYTATCSGKLAMVDFLLQLGANVNMHESDFGCTPLHEAVCHGDEALTRLLLSRGAKINAKTGYGWTALREAAFNDKWPLIRLLIDHGALVSPQDQQSIDASLGRRRDADSIMAAAGNTQDT